MKKLVIIQTVAPDYRELFFERIKEVLGDHFELFAGDESFEKTVKTKSSIKKDLKNHFLFHRKLLFQTGIWHLLLKNDVLVLEMNPRNISNWIFLIIRKLFGKKTVLWGHAWPRKGQNNKSDILRNTMRMLASKIIVYTKQQQKELHAKMPNKTILAASNAVYKQKNMKTEIRNNPSNLIYVGRLVANKKVFFMAKAFAHSLEMIPDDANLIIVGDGEEKEKIESFINHNNLQNRVQVLGHINKYETLKKLYDTAIFSLSPGYVGLSVTQSFGFGVPMLISKNENHAPEIEAVIAQENAVFFNTDDIDDFSKKLQRIYTSKNEWIEKREQIVDFCKKNYSVEAMAQVFIDLVND